MRRAPIVSACLQAACGSKETIYITSTENAPPDLTSEPVTTTTADSAPTDTAGTADTADTGTPGPTGDHRRAAQSPAALRQRSNTSALLNSGT